MANANLQTNKVLACKNRHYGGNKFVLVYKIDMKEGNGREEEKRTPVDTPLFDVLRTLLTCLHVDF